jgi:hypothetical protein
MARKTIITIIALIAVLGILYWIQQSRDNDDASASTVQSVSAYNQTKNADATTVSANPNDVLVYTLTVRNTSDDVVSGYVVETNIEDISELATLTDAQGANYNENTKSLLWTPLDIPANGEIQKTFSVKVKDSLPTDSDLIMTTTYNNEVIVSVAKSQVAGSNNPGPVPTPKAPYKAPTSGPSTWFAVLLALTFTMGIIMYRAGKKINA